MQNCNTNVKPQIYQIELTERCNLKCPMCPNHLMKDKKDAGRGLIDAIVQGNYLENTIYTEFQFSGEPTLSPILDYAISEIKKTNTMVGLSTNLTTVYDKIDSLKKLDCITVSMDIFDKEIYETSRFPSKFSDFLERFEFLMRKLEMRTLVQLQLLRTAWTEEKYDQAKENLLDYLAEKKYNNIIVREMGDSFIEYHHHGSSEMNSGFNEICLNPFYTVSIKADGTVVPCSLDFFKDMPLGNVYDNSLEEIWKGMPLEILRNSFTKIPGLMSEKCKKCYGRSPIVYMNKVIIQKLLEYKLFASV